MIHKIPRVLRTAFLVLAAFLWGMAAHAETITYFHNDVSGTPLAATDAAGNVVWKESYRPYGDLMQPPNGSNALWFTGKPYDTSTGLSYFGARYYDPLLGRFVGIDPEGFNENNLHSFNRYAYANNNPNKYIDPDGRAAETILDVVSLGLSLQAYRNDPSLLNAAGVAYDGIATVVPFLPAGFGIIKSAGNAADALNDGTRATNVPAPDGGFTADLSKTTAKSRSGHSYAGNKQLHEEMKTDPKFRADIEKRYGSDVFDRTSTSGGGRRNPAGAEWDHSSSNPNHLDLRTVDNHRQKTRAEGQAGGGWKQYRKNRE